MNERRNAWVKETVARMRTAEKNDPASVGAVIVNNEKVIVTITKNIDNPRIGVAMVNGNDDFDLDTGLAIAYTKARGQELPCFITCDGCDDDYEDDDDYYDDDEDDEDYDDEDYDDDDEDEDDDWDDDEDDDEDEDEVLDFDDIPIGTRFLDFDDDLCMKISETKYYCYLMNEILPCNEDDAIVKKVIQ